MLSFGVYITENEQTGYYIWGCWLINVMVTQHHLSWCISLLLLHWRMLKGLVDVWDDTTTRNGGLDEGVELLVTSDGELKMSRSDSLDLEVL